MVSVSAALRLSGFSHVTILPARAAAMAISAWVLLGLTISIRSIFGSSTTLRQSVSQDSYPHLAAKSLASGASMPQMVLRTVGRAGRKNG